MILENIIQHYSITPGLRNEVDEVFMIVLFVQRVFGHQILDPTWSWSKYWLKHLCTLLLLIYVTLGTVEILRNASDITIMAEAVYTIIITTFFCIKYALFIKTKNIFQKVYLAVKTTLYQAVKEESKDLGGELLEKAKLVVKLFFIIVFVPNVSYWLTALWYYIAGTRVTLSRTTSILMPMTSPTYEIGLALHAIYLFDMAFTLLVIDMWFVFFMSFFCEASDSFVKILKVDPKYTGESDASYAKRLNQSLRNFHKRHIQLMDYLNTLNVMYKWVTLIPLCHTLICTCLICVLITEEVSWTFASNILPTFCELFAYNWLGENIKSKADSLSMALMDFDWTSMELKDKKNYLIIVCYMNKDFGIRTAIGQDLSFVTMSTILKASYQAFAMLKTMGG